MAISPDMITAGANAVSTVASTISNIIDQTKRRQFEQAFALLSARQQLELNEKIAAANTQTERLQILSNNMLQFAIANQASANKSKTTLYFLAGGLGIVLLAAGLLFSLKKKG